MILCGSPVARARSPSPRCSGRGSADSGAGFFAQPATSRDGALAKSPWAPGAPALAGAAQALDAVISDGGSADAVLGAIEAAADRAAVRAITLGTIRWYLRLAPAVEPLLTNPSAVSAPVRALLIVAAHQIEYSRNAPEVTVHAAVNAARILRCERATGFVNAVLRRFVRERAQLFARVDQAEPARTAHPEWLIGKLQAAWPHEYAAMLAANNVHPPMTLRLNLSSASAESYIARLSEAGIESSLVQWIDSAVTLNRPMSVSALPGFEEGWVSVQDAGAQLAPRLLDMRPGMRVLDACAAPGARPDTCWNAHLWRDRPGGDIDAGRVARIEENLKRLGTSATLVVADVSEPGSFWDGRPFDLHRSDGTTRERKNYLVILSQVSSFYLDIQEWAHGRPVLGGVGRAQPGPPQRAGRDGEGPPEDRSQMHQRVRERLPHLQRLADSAAAHRTAMRGLSQQPRRRGRRGAQHDGITYRRTLHKSYLEQTPRCRAGTSWSRTPPPASRSNVTEHGGRRVLDLGGHRDPPPHRRPDRGTAGDHPPRDDLLPAARHRRDRPPAADRAVQGNEERLLLVSPELASVLATVISRLRDRNGGTSPWSPATTAREDHRAAAAAPVPAQERLAARHQPHPDHPDAQRRARPGRHHRHRGPAAAATPPTTSAACSPPRPSPAACRSTSRRRCSATAASPPPRPTSPSSRTNSSAPTAPSSPSAGPCARGRVPRTHRRGMARVPGALREPQSRARHLRSTLRHPLPARARLHPLPHAPPRPRRPGRLAEIIRNLADRIAEARINGWLGEVEGLQVSLNAARAKLAALDRTARNTHPAPPTSACPPSPRPPGADP